MAAYVLDTELTDKKAGEIIEAAWIRFAADPDLCGDSIRIPASLSPCGTYYNRFQPSKPISFGAMAVHHILPYELEHCPPSSTFAMPDDCAYLIGHSIDTDWQAIGSPAHIKRIDTHAIAQWLWPDATGYSQVALIYMLEGATDAVRERVLSAHSASSDTWLNYSLLGHILKLKPEIQTWEQLWEYSEECRIPRTCPMKRYEGVLLENLDTGFIGWCLGLYDLDPYYRKGLQRVMDARFPNGRSRYSDDRDDDDDDDDGDDMLPAQVESRYPNDVVNEAPADDVEDECADCLAHPTGECNEHLAHNLGF